MDTNITGPSLTARQLGFGGLIPFVSLASALWLMSPADWPQAGPALLAYGATIASFLGAIHWGLVMRAGSPKSGPALVWGVIPSLLSWVALMLGGAAGLLLIATLLAICYAVDRAVYPHYLLQAWLPMRLGLTVVATVSCIVGAAALLR